MGTNLVNSLNFEYLMLLNDKSFTLFVDAGETTWGPSGNLNFYLV